MGFSFAGVQLQLEDEDNEVHDWMERIIPLEGIRCFAKETADERNRPHGMTIPNWADKLKVRLNTWYSPTGAARWGFGFFLATRAQLQQMIAAQPINVGGGIPTGMNWLILDDLTGGPGKYLGVAVPAQMLPAHPISMSNTDPGSYWIVPIVDVRYYWQFQPSTGTAWCGIPGQGGGGQGSFWFTGDGRGLIDAAFAKLMGLQNATMSTIAAAYNTNGQINPHGWTFDLMEYQNMAVQFDVVLASLGMRLVPKFQTLYGGANPQGNFPWFAIQNFTDANNTLLSGFAPSEANGALQVGVVPEASVAYGNIVPSSVVVAFRNCINGRVVGDKGSNHTAYTFGPADVGIPFPTTSGTQKFIRSTALADYAVIVGNPAIDGQPHNDATLRALAKQIATDYYGWISWFQDQTFVGVPRFLQNGFEDYREYRFDRIREGKYKGEFAMVTRCHTMPHNFACDDLLHMDSTVYNWTLPPGVGNAQVWRGRPWEWGKWVIGTLDGPLPPGGVQTIAVTQADVYYYTDLAQPDATTFPRLAVTEGMGQNFANGGTVVAVPGPAGTWFTIMGTASSGGITARLVTPQNNAVIYQGPPIPVNVTYGLANIPMVAFLPAGAVLMNANYLAVQNDLGSWEIVNPELTITISQNFNSIVCTQPGKTVWQNCSLAAPGGGLPLNFSVLISRGVGFVGINYRAVWCGDSRAFEVSDPSMMFLCRASKTVVGNQQTSMTVVNVQNQPVNPGVQLDVNLYDGLLYGTRVYRVRCEPDNSYTVEPDIWGLVANGSNTIPKGQTGQVVLIAGAQGLEGSTNVQIVVMARWGPFKPNAKGRILLDKTAGGVGNQNAPPTWTIESTDTC